MQKKVISLVLALLLAVTGLVRAEELTVNTGTVTNAYVPVYGFYADAYLKAEFVTPAADLASMGVRDTRCRPCQHGRQRHHKHEVPDRPPCT